MPFTDAAWDGSAVESRLDAAAYCAVSLIDLNASGADKVKGKCKLPVRATRGGPYNLNAMSAAAGALAGARGGLTAPGDAKRKAARALVRLYREAGNKPPPALLRVAGMRG